MQIRPYLIFKGECQDAIELYKKAFKTDTDEVMRFSDMPQSSQNNMQIPDNQLNWVLMATMPFGNIFIRLSDTVGELNDASTERISISVETKVEEVKHAFDILVKEGNVGIPLLEIFFQPMSWSS
jgi:PhnB protein